MSRGPGRVQRGISEALHAYRTTEPWPVVVSPRGIAKHIYDTKDPDRAEMEAVFRALRTTDGFEHVPRRPPWPRHGLSFPVTPLEDYLRKLHAYRVRQQYHALIGDRHHRLHVDRPGYRPDPPQLAAAFEQIGFQLHLRCARAESSVTVQAAAEAVNAWCGTSYTPGSLEEIWEKPLSFIEQIRSGRTIFG